MTFRGIYRDGVVFIEDPSGLRNGTVVDVVRPAKKIAKAKKKATAKSARAKKRDPFLALMGIWKDRPEWKGKNALEIQQELRRKALGNRSHA